MISYTTIIPYTHVWSRCQVITICRFITYSSTPVILCCNWIVWLRTSCIPENSREGVIYICILVAQSKRGFMREKNGLIIGTNHICIFNGSLPTSMSFSHISKPLNRIQVILCTCTCMWYIPTVWTVCSTENLSSTSLMAKAVLPALVSPINNILYVLLIIYSDD